MEANKLPNSLMRRIPRYFLLCVFAVTFPYQVAGDNIYWLGGDGNWNNANNWDIGWVPGAGLPGQSGYEWFYVYITAPGNYIVTLNDMDAWISSLTLGTSNGTQTLFVDGQDIVLVEENTQSTIHDSGYVLLSNSSIIADTAWNMLNDEMLTNHGTVQMVDSSLIALPFVNQGDVVVSRGYNWIMDDFSNTSSGRLGVESPVDLEDFAALEIHGFTNEGIIELDAGPQGHFAYLRVESTEPLVNAFGAEIRALGTAGEDTVYLDAYTDNQGTITVSGLFLMGRGGDVVLDNSGTVRVLNGNLTLRQLNNATGNCTNDGGTIEIALNTSVTVQGGFMHNDVDGTIRGDGTLDVLETDFTNYGTLEPGLSTGRLTIAGDVTMLPPSILDIEIGGHTEGVTYDQLNILGNVALAGTLRVSLTNNFIPTVGDTFQILTYATRQGFFSDTVGLFFDDELFFEPVYGPTSMYLVTVGPDSNHAPEGFLRLLPADHSIQPPDSVRFTWTRSTDLDGDTVSYSLSLQVGGIDTLFSTFDTTLSVDFRLFALPADSLEVTWTVTASDGNQNTYPENGTGTFTLNNTLGIGDGQGTIPSRFALEQNYPNPFNTHTRWTYVLPERSQVTITLYDVLGREVRTLVNRVESPGIKSMDWDGRDDVGRSLSGGVYLYQITAVDPTTGNRRFTRTRKMVFLK